ncbi:hypothetical protein [Chitinimonas sp. BJYL2]|uniref:hypothetical protein n=1 Tax=Chitinimonas sp. BJYL2 TaxID=2976696 RepID=UPI0022B36D41|nr:hypothetical protein [Chitinimonas sp. BJYL2]
MFTLLRVLFLLLLLAWALCLWKEKRSGDALWRRRRRWVGFSALGLLAFILIGLFLQRLLA